MKTTSSIHYLDVLGDRVEGSHGNFFCIRMKGGNGQLVTEIDQNGHPYYTDAVSNTTGLNDGAWHYIAAVRQGTSLKVYINGNLDVSVTAQGLANLTGSKPFKLGNSYSGFPPADIEFKDVRIYNGKALCPKRISEIFDQGRPIC
jgi:Laminin G domain.